MKTLVSISILAALLSSCAHVTAVAKTCTPTAAIVTAVAGDFATDGYEAALVDLIEREGWCIVSAAVDQWISTATNVKASGIDIATSLQHAREWRATHPA